MTHDRTFRAILFGGMKLARPYRTPLSIFFRDSAISAALRYCERYRAETSAALEESPGRLEQTPSNLPDRLERPNPGSRLDSISCKWWRERPSIVGTRREESGGTGAFRREREREGGRAIGRVVSCSKTRN